MGRTEPHRVAVLGGGLGALTAAFDLTRPELEGRFEVTVYQLGWRLGGKGATGRDRKHDDRIQEHGLHMMMGWYDHVFTLMRDCYEEWDPPADYPIRTIDEAFLPQRSAVLSENLAPPSSPPDWHLWDIPFPQLPGEPWDGSRDEEHPAVLLRRLVGWLAEPARLVGVELSKPHHRATWTGHALAHEMARDPKPHHHESLVRELDELWKAAERTVGEDLTSIDRDLREAWILLRLGLAFAKGILFDVLPHGRDGWDKINDVDLKDWLDSHGATTPEVSYSAPVRAFYYLTFAYLNGDTSSYETASVAAGVAAKVMLRIAFTYRNAPFYKMATAMGDTIMTPLYEVLKRRGVAFEFFSRVTDIAPDAGGRTVDTITIDRQATVVDGEYQPLYAVKGLHTWPSEPLWAQLENGEELEASGIDFESEWSARSVNTVTLVRGTHFDSVVLGISLGALPLMAPKLGAANSDWQAMYDGMPTIQTQAAQLWTRPDLEGLGWNKGTYVASAWLQPMASGIADMSQVIPTENYRDVVPGSVQYVTAPLPQTVGDPYGDPDYPQQQLAATFKNTDEWLNRAAGRMFPKAAGPNGFDYDVLFGSGSGQDRLRSQYFRANVDPSERYVLTLPKTVHLRLDPAESGFDNLFPAGDWVRTSVNGGSAEAAVEGGDLAASALIERFG